MDDRLTEVAALADPGSFRPQDLDLVSRDPLAYPGYIKALEAAAERAGTDESVIAGSAEIEGHPVELAVFNFAFMGGSMGEVAGERLARGMERAAAGGLPFVLRTTTGGARMQEGMRSLIQMPKVVVARLGLAEAHQPFIAVLGHPTTGGVYASLASLADLTIAEEDATLGFAGPRVAERVTGESLPPDTHTASSAYDNGMVDGMVAPDRVRGWIADALRCLADDAPTGATVPPARAGDARIIDAWDAVTSARGRKAVPIEVADLLDDGVALEGDRFGQRAGALGSWLARIEGRRFLLMKAGDPLRPDAYRKALRCIDIAVRLDVPIVTLVDTAGADPSVDSEREGIAGLIARLFERMLTTPVPILSIVTGEGGSGGALAFAAADLLVVYETSYFSVIGPEAAAEILWRDASRAPEAARALKLTAPHLKDLGIADQLIAGEPTPRSLRQAVTYHLDLLTVDRSTRDPSSRRRDRWRKTW